MNFDDIFSEYYTLYRAEATTPASTDDEYTIAMRLANEAIARWANYDSTYWRELYDTNQNSETGAQTIVTAQTAYAAPVNFKEAGGFVKVKNSSGGTVHSYPIIEPQDAQTRGDNSYYAYFTNSPLYYSTGTASQSGTTITGSGTTFTAAMVGMQFTFSTGETATITAYTSATSITASVSQTVSSTTYKIESNGWKLNLNPAPTADINGMDIDYVYYKKPTEITSGETVPDMSNPRYIVHRMLANRFRASRNPYYASANKDAEDALRMMQGDNNSGTWTNPPVMSDTSGSSWGV